MTLAPGFLFSQSSLQDYVDCQRRFQMRSLMHLAWPAIDAAPAAENEKYTQMGDEFHYLIRQHIVGISIEHLTSTIDQHQEAGKGELAQWWENYLMACMQIKDLEEIIPSEAPKTTKYLPEFSLSIPIRNHRLIAKYDLLIILPANHAIIIDWKTSRNHPKRSWLQERLQTRVYPYVLVAAGNPLNSNTQFLPENVEMRYWYANFPDETEVFIYSSEQYQADNEYLIELINQIDHKNEDDFPLTHNELQCRFCVYRSLCNRGIQAGSIEFHAYDDNITNLDFNLEQIDEIEY